jgi:hypothetical protein
MLYGKTSYAGNFTVRGVRKIRNAKLCDPPYAFSFKYDLMIISTSAFQA